MMVFFLGGPWHNERHEVTPGRKTAAMRSLPTYFKVTLRTDESEELPGASVDASMLTP